MVHYERTSEYQSALDPEAKRRYKENLASVLIDSDS